MRIVNVFALFQNPCNDPGWQMWDGSSLIGVYHTRGAARIAAVRIIDERTDYDAWTVKFHRDGSISAIKDANKTFAGPENCRQLVTAGEGR